MTELHVGYSDSLVRVVTAQDVATFAKLSGDYNALHVDDEFAARTEFEQRVVHGFLHASLLSTLVGMKMPGRGALYLSQSIDFTHPVFIGDEVTATGIITKIDKATRIISIATKIVNQDGRVVLNGDASVKVLRLAAPAPPKPQAKAALMDDLLTGQCALVTGASRGIGRAIALTLAAHGAKVFVNFNRSEAAAHELVAQITNSGGTASAIKADVTNDDDVAAMLAQITNAGRLDILINNAGPKIKSAAFAALAWSDMAQAYEQIVGSTFRVTQAALPGLKAAKSASGRGAVDKEGADPSRKGGRIINVLTSAALGRTAYNWLPYVSAKNALLGMSKNLAQELGPAGITVNMVSPSMVDTDLTANVPDKIRQMMVGRTPLRRLATVDDVAGAVLFLASPFATFITGDNLLVTGGDVMM